MEDHFHSHQLTSHVKFVHKVVLVKDGQVLLLRRNPHDKTRPNCWDLPGGNMEWPAEVKQSATDLHRAEVVRELREETGIEMSPDQVVSQNLVFLETYFDQPHQVFRIYCGWALELPVDFGSSQVKLSDEHTDFAWVGLSDLDQYDFGGESGGFIVRHIQEAFN